ncbi:hypothetical protein Q7P37_009821 [Cladosporium fusiforme]
MIKPASKPGHSITAKVQDRDYATPKGGHGRKPQTFGERKTAVALQRTESPRTPPMELTKNSTPLRENVDLRIPVTPVSGVSNLNVHISPPGSTMPTAKTGPCSSLKRKRSETKTLEGDRTINISNDEAGKNIVEEQCFLDDHAMQSVFDRLISHRFVNDDCINMLLQAFNSDPERWYVATSYMLKVGDPTGTVPSRFKEVSALPRMLLFPLYIANAAHWALAVYDRERRHCDVFDARKDGSAAALCWKTVQSLLVEHRVLKGNATVDLDPFPSVQQTDHVNCGVYVLAVALHVLHGVAVNSISPELWRVLLAAFFSKEIEPPRSSLLNSLDDTAESAATGQRPQENIESRMGKVEETRTKELEVLSYAEQTKLLHAIVETQLRGVAKREGERQRLIDMAEWYSAMPKHCDILMMELVSKRKQETTKKLKQMPKVLRGCSRQLGLLKACCSAMIEDCDRATAHLKERSDDLLEAVMTSYQDLCKRLAAIRE